MDVFSKSRTSRWKMCQVSNVDDFDFPLTVENKIDVPSKLHNVHQ